MRPYFCLPFLISPVLSGFLNVTVDDTNPRIAYSPQNAWNLVDSSQNNSQTEPDTGRAYNYTLHKAKSIASDGALSLFANITFTGSAVYVFGALAGAPSTTPSTLIGFYIDGQLINNFTSPEQIMSSPSAYNVSLFSKTGLGDGEHILNIADGPDSLVLLDYIVYTTEDENTLPSSSSSPLPLSHVTAKVVATAVIVPIVAFLLSVIAFCVYRRRRQRRKTANLPYLRNWKRDTVTPVPMPAMNSWSIEPITLPPSHPASGYVNGSGKPATKSVPSAPPSSITGSQLAAAYRTVSEAPKSFQTDARTEVSSASTSTYGKVIYIHGLSGDSYSTYLHS
ncbi:hypothetical protein D9757_003536 [Collybiopsis confluens]|uniref:Uncharacterized protein n=1 Tax=Collybiopsis confluens TaxID=2823264 RepID=A0A8H5HTN7_9AGAR|nr:hypothetical protein D9757_003536 [Collybiopsis confluens]